MTLSFTTPRRFIPTLTAPQRIVKSYAGRHTSMPGTSIRIDEQALKDACSANRLALSGFSPGPKTRENLAVKLRVRLPRLSCNNAPVAHRLLS